MSYQKHPLFEPPERDDATLWRYMDFTKFVWMLENRSLFFSRADRLSDSWEGAVSELNVIGRQLTEFMAPSGEADNLARLNEAMRLHTFISCWHENDHESAALWRLYSRSEENTVALRTTLQRLRSSLDCYETHDIYIGKVKYIDYSKERIPEGNVYAPFLYKRKSFAHENEVRAVVQPIWPSSEPLVGSPPSFENGMPVPIDLSALVEEVYVSPTSPTWIGALVAAVSRNYGIQVGIRRSSLASDPMY